MVHLGETRFLRETLVTHLGGVLVTLLDDFFHDDVVEVASEVRLDLVLGVRGEGNLLAFD